ncbi:MAG: hypothetical protein AAGF85_20845 [Bacteroidota bacterium]
MSRGKRGRRGKRNQGKGLSRNFEADSNGGEVTLGWEKAGIGVSVTFSGETITVTLGIGVASVEYDLGEPNNSTVSYAFDLYEISGERDGCTVTLEYRIAGKLVKTEIRRIPDCEDEKEEEEDKDDGFSEDDPGEGTGEESSDDPPGEPWDVGYYLIGLRVNSSSVFVSNPGLFRVGITRSYSSVSGAILQDENEEYYYTYKAFHYGFSDRYYQAYTGATKLTRRIHFPKENSGRADYESYYVWRFGGTSIPRAAALSGRFIYGENWRVKR